MATILLAGPQTAHARELLGILEVAGHRVWSARGMEEASALMSCVPVDLIIVQDDGAVDLRGLMSGISPPTAVSPPPVVVMAQTAGAQRAGDALAAGACDILPTPVEAGEAKEIIHRALGSEPSCPGADGAVSLTAENGVLEIILPERADSDVAAQLSCLLGEGFVVPERGVIVQMARTKYLASSVIGVLYLLTKLCCELRGRLYICGGGPRIEHLLQLTGLWHFYQKAATVEDARSAL